MENAGSHPRLAATVAFRHLGAFAVLVDQRNGLVLRLSAAAGRLLEALESGTAPALGDADREFLASLAARDLLEGPPPPAAAKRPAPVPAQPGGVLARINADAAAAHVPLHLQLEVTYRCPLSCRHCYLAPARTARVPELSLPEIEDLLDQSAALGTLFLLLTGGEPFARPDLRRIYDAARDLRFSVSLLTSGFGADPGLLEHLAARGLDGIQVSLHGPDAPSHDRLTGVPGSFDAALSCLRRCRDLGIRTRAGVTVTRDNLDRLADLRSLLEDEGIPAALGLYLEPRRDGDPSPTALAVDEDGVRHALELFPPSSPARMAGLGMEDAPCRAGSSVLAVDPTGTVHPCLSLRTATGSIRERSVSDIWREATALRRLRELRLADLDDCPGCEQRAHCDRCAGFAVGAGSGITGHTAFDCLQARVRRAVAADPEYTGHHNQHLTAPPGGAMPINRIGSSTGGES